MAPLIVAFAPAAKIEAKVTSATPIMSAAAVTAVRPGWRTEFSRASWPVMPVARSIGRPMTFASGRTSRGESSATPRKVSAAPPPMNEIAALSDFRLPNSPTHMSAHADREQQPGADGHPPPAPALHRHDALAQRLHRRHARGAQRRRDAGDEAHHRAHEDRDDHRAALDDDALARQVGAERLEQRAQERRGPDAQQEADDAADEAEQRAPRRRPPARPGGATRRGCAAARTRACAGRR